MTEQQTRRVAPAHSFKRDTDPAENAAFYDRIAEQNVAPLWRVPGTDAPEPATTDVAHVWHYRDLFPLIEDAAERFDLGKDADRRALNGVNPARMKGTTHTMIAGYQLVMPGESAPAHRHTPGAIRLALSGHGHTVTQGEPLVMEPGDLVLTPPWTWHDHRNDTDEPMLWLDGLDVPFVQHLNAQFYEDYEGKTLQPAQLADDASTDFFGTGLVSRERPFLQPYSPLTKYPYSTTRPALERLHDAEGGPSHGVEMEFVNPVTGGPVVPTLSCAMRLMPGGGETVERRHTSSTIFCVIEGSGHTIVDGERYDWDRFDFFAIPSWKWYRHVADPGCEVVLFSMSDRPMLEPFHLYREETRGA